MWWQLAVGVVAALLLGYVLLVLSLWLVGRREGIRPRAGDMLRLLPDVLRLLRRIIADRQLSAGVRLPLILLLVYLASPIDLVPDFIPVVGYADDVIVLALAVRLVVRRAGPATLEKHWPGTEAGLAVIRRLAGL